jgi:hypothetical protein
VIGEALVADCPVLTSDQTPWRGLEQLGTGWDIPLTRSDLFHNVLQLFVEMDPVEFSAWSQSARRHGLEHSADSAAIVSNRQLFELAAVGARGASR